MTLLSQHLHLKLSQHLHHRLESWGLGTPLLGCCVCMYGRKGSTAQEHALGRYRR